jgi:hypothetical protein
MNNLKMPFMAEGSVCYNVVDKYKNCTLNGAQNEDFYFFSLNIK